MTEMTALICSVPLGQSLVELQGTVGKLMPTTQARIINPHTGQDLSTNEEGELLVRSGNRCLGYYNQIKKTRDTIDKDGWLHTGDVARFDARGYFWITDRIKELIKFKGRSIAPAVLEGILLGHPGVADCAVVGQPDREAGELPKAFVVRRSDSRVTEAEIMRFVDDQVSPYSRLRGGVQFIQHIPKSPSGKILRRKLRDRTQPTVKAKL